MKMKELHILAVGGITRPQKFLNSAGCYITWIDESRSGLRIGNEDLARCRNLVILNRDSREQDYIEVARSLHKIYPFDFVCAFHDRSQKIANSVSLELNVPTCISASASTMCRDKTLMRKRLERDGLRSVRYTRVGSPQDARDFMNSLGMPMKPIIVKPLLGEGSSQVTLIEPAHATQQLKGLNWREAWIAEEFLEGKEYSVEGFSRSGQHTLIAVTEKFKAEGSFVESAHLVPARLDEEQEHRVKSYVTDCLTALDVKDGPTHSEVILTQNGPVLIETHTRTGGDGIPDLVNAALGVDLYEQAAKSAIDMTISDEDLTPKTQGIWACSRFFVQTKTGKIMSIDGLDDARKTAGVQSLAVSYDVGQTLPAVRDSYDRAANCVAVGESPQQVLDTTEQALNLLQFRLETPNEQGA